ncbi:hypothetical protein IGI04_011401 [Brassica rapa subsp. trilocularis]|uniref:Large ribosomal subunit protein mL54 n=1 Tax=Brassica rapa subsp. trilocularis TaxID=1813537 RepID=A0ABQ7N2Z5_BRACM|nr:hypothetical protein IGI04_011401 [Brassica rapa subsp. trilocularis]
MFLVFGPTLETFGPAQKENPKGKASLVGWLIVFLPHSLQSPPREMNYRIGLITGGSKDVVRRTFAAAASKAKKGGKGGGSDAPKGSSLSKEIKSTTVVGANTLKDGSDPKILPDSDYPDWLWRLLQIRPALSELRRKNVETLPYDDLKRFVKLDTRAKIKENNSIKAKN